ncbi:MAG: DUF3459 domain-containing protein [Microthrixaceae bacterium]
MLEHYRRLLGLRRSLPALNRGEMELLDAPEGVVRWRRYAESGPHRSVEVAINFTAGTIEDAIGDGHVLGGTALPGEQVAAGDLGPDEARIVALD